MLTVMMRMKGWVEGQLLFIRLDYQFCQNDVGTQKALPANVLATHTKHAKIHTQNAHKH